MKCKDVKPGQIVKFNNSRYRRLTARSQYKDTVFYDFEQLVPGTMRGNMHIEGLDGELDVTLVLSKSGGLS